MDSKTGRWLYSWLVLLCLGLATVAQASSLSETGRRDTLRTQSPSGVVHYVYVYLPPNYMPEQTYPVLYLMHGFMGNQYSWEVKGNVGRQLDSLIACRAIQPLIVAMPYCIPKDTTQAVRQRSFFYNATHYAQLKRGEFEKTFPEVVGLVQDRYPVDTSFQAVAGLSYGARVAANVAKMGRYDCVGLFSPVLGRHQLPEAASPSRYWVSVGRKDFFFRRMGRRLHRRLSDGGFHCSYQEIEAGHNWKNWRVALLLFLKDWIPVDPE